MKNSGVVCIVPTAKKRCKCLLVISVLALVFLSMLVPLLFLFGQHNNALFRSTTAIGYGYGIPQQSSTPNHARVFDLRNAADERNQTEDHGLTHLDGLINRLAVPTLTKEFGNNSVKQAGNNSTGFPVPADLSQHVKKDNGILARDSNRKNIVGADENEMICELKFGIYCLWRREHKEKMKDSLVKRMKDLLFVARAYYPSIAKLPALEKLSHELRQNIQDFERVLSETTTDKDIPPQNDKRLNKMESAIAKAKSYHVDCSNVDKKFRQLVDLTEDEANFHTKQSAFLYKLAVQTMPKSLHCLSMRLTLEYFKSSLDTEQTMVDKFLNPNLHHYVIFSKNILASSVVINSTVVHSRESEKQVFHLVTDRENYFAMKLWFSENKYGDAAVRVLDIEDAKLYTNPNMAPLHLSLPEEFRISFRGVDELSSTAQIRTDYLSMFSHSHYLLPILFQTLQKVVVLDDDVLVQRDLSALWDLDMGGKVNGAVQFCVLKLFHLKSYLASRVINDNTCAWTTGVNIINLSRWKALNLTERYNNFLHEMRRDGGSPETSTLTASLLTFQDLVYALEDSWVQSGLGHNYGVNHEVLKTAAVLHFDGSMKPWLELGIPMYKSLWRKFLNQRNQYLSDCNII